EAGALLHRLRSNMRDEYHEGHRARWLRSLEVIPRQPRDRSPVVGTVTGGAYIANHTNQFKEAVEDKLSQHRPDWKQLILLVEFDTLPLLLGAIPDIRWQAREMSPPFNEIWAVNNYATDRRCWCVWP